jgi:4-hydroxy-L-threonine phosphate dehydrogenase PdxA
MGSFIQNVGVNKNNADYVLKTLDLGTQYCLNGNTQALVTGPLHKYQIK